MKIHPPLEISYPAPERMHACQVRTSILPVFLENSAHQGSLENMVLLQQQALSWFPIWKVTKTENLSSRRPDIPFMPTQDCTEVSLQSFFPPAGLQVSLTPRKSERSWYWNVLHASEGNDIAVSRQKLLNCWWIWYLWDVRSRSWSVSNVRKTFAYLEAGWCLEILFIFSISMSSKQA